MGFLNKLEKKMGRYAIKRLTRYIIFAYIIGYVLLIISAYSNIPIHSFLSLHPGAILSGQVWRIVTWVLVPPASLNFFTIIMLFCYYQLGTLLERVWGDFLYNVYIFFGLIMTIVGAFIMYFAGGALLIDMTAGLMFSTYYVSLSIFLGFAMTFPEQKMLLFFIIPIRIKYLAIFDIAYLTYLMIIGDWMTRVQIICSLSATIIFFFLTRKKAFRSRRSNIYDFKVRQAQAEARRRAAAAGTNPARAASPAGKTGNPYSADAPIHRCTICGKTEKDDPNLEFRYCSKCAGNHEYCSDHLFTHVHIVKGGE